MLPKSLGLKVPLLRSHKDCAWNLLIEVRRAAGDLSCVSFSSEGYFIGYECSIEYEYFYGYSMRVIPCNYKHFGPRIYKTFVREKFKKTENGNHFTHLLFFPSLTLSSIYPSYDKVSLYAKGDEEEGGGRVGLKSE